jgi:hypothetical protein
MRDAPVMGIACVVDRPGYRARYLEKYQQQPWMLCKTAFSIVLERAAKFARTEERKLRVHPERCNKAEDGMLRGYYLDLKANGSPFAAATSEKYGPLSQPELNETLYELDFKFKSSPMAQLADLYLWPICMGGYHAGNATSTPKRWTSSAPSTAASIWSNGPPEYKKSPRRFREELSATAKAISWARPAAYIAVGRPRNKQS